tara:strand:+ start:460468 stop:461067 length:600 start_codon:yes stop_codon:yes gene_type:complete
MTAVLTGDIINSRSGKTPNWLGILKETLQKFGKEPEQWEIYRGDSFQLEVSPKKALETAIFIKSSIKKEKNIDVRMAIGIGNKTYTSNKVTTSNGTAFINSGECFDNLKKLNLAIQTPWSEFDEQINLSLELALLTMNNWSPATATILTEALEKQHHNQKELAATLNKSQSSISEALSRAGYDEIIKLIDTYKKKLPQS